MQALYQAGKVWTYALAIYLRYNILSYFFQHDALKMRKGVRDLHSTLGLLQWRRLLRLLKIVPLIVKC